MEDIDKLGEALAKLAAEDEDYDEENVDPDELLQDLEELDFILSNSEAILQLALDELDEQIDREEEATADYDLDEELKEEELKEEELEKLEEELEEELEELLEEVEEVVEEVVVEGAGDGVSIDALALGGGDVSDGVSDDTDDGDIGKGGRFPAGRDKVAAVNSDNSLDTKPGQEVGSEERKTLQVITKLACRVAFYKCTYSSALHAQWYTIHLRSI